MDVGLLNIEDVRNARSQNEFLLNASYPPSNIITVNGTLTCLFAIHE